TRSSVKISTPPRANGTCGRQTAILTPFPALRSGNGQLAVLRSRMASSDPRDDRVVERREEDLADSLVDVLGMAWSVQEARLHLAEAGLAGEQRERLGDERLPVRQVGEVRAERERRERVDRLGDQDPAGPERANRKLEQPEQRRGRQDLDELGGEDPAERALLDSLQVGERIRLLDLEALAAGVGDHVRVCIDAARLDSRVAEQAEELAAAAADVEHGRRIQEVLHVRALALADVGGLP